jgi:flagellar motility protein MotE (MotC chaperone)
MIRYLRELRLLPIAVVACACLLTLIAADLLLDDGSSVGGNTVADAGTSVVRTTPDVSPPMSSMKSWASQMFNFPDGSGATPAQSPMVAAVPTDRTDITGSVPEPPEKLAKGDSKTGPDSKVQDGKAQDAKAPTAKTPQTTPMGTAIPLDGQPSGAERAILERLQERRQELDARARELDIRESLIQAAEKRMDGQLAELKDTEQRIKAATQQRDDADAARFKGLVTMYETMKPRDAAKIFDRLDIGVLIEMASKIKPQAMADIMAQMSPDNAQRLTVELASKAQDGRQASSNPIELPKIQGQPTGR